MAEVLHVYRTPDEDLPIAPAGVQKAPGVTVGIAVGAGVVEAVGLGEGLEIVDAIGDGVGFWDS